MRRREALLGLPVLLAACAHGPGASPMSLDLRLSPASLGRELALQQRMTVETRGQRHAFDIGLEVDAQTVRLAVLSFGQTLARLEWDGRELKEERTRGWPEAVKGEAVLRDVQLVHWPEQAIRPALPAGWSLEADAQERRLQHRDDLFIRVRYPRAGQAELQNLAQGYAVLLESGRASS